MKKPFTIIGLLFAGVLLTSGQTNWSATEPSVLALGNLNADKLEDADAILSHAQTVWNMTGVPAKYRTNVATKVLRSTQIKMAAEARSYAVGAGRIQVLSNALVSLGSSVFTPYAHSKAMQVSNQCLGTLVANYLALGATNLANQAKNRLMIDPVNGDGVVPLVRALFDLGSPAAALNQAEGVLTNGTVYATTGHIIAREILKGTGFSGQVFNQPASWEAYLEGVTGKVRIKSLVTYSLTNFPVQNATSVADAKLQLMWLRVEAGSMTNKVTQLRRLLRQVAQRTPLNEGTAEFLGWLRGFHRSLSFAMPDEADPTAFNEGAPGRTRTPDEQMEAAETLVGVIAPYGSSVWGEKWRRGMTPEEAAEFAALRGQ